LPPIALIAAAVEEWLRRRRAAASLAEPIDAT
jgi:hypothetical protein